jgi:hypothetical protein
MLTVKRANKAAVERAQKLADQNYFTNQDSK